MALEYAPPPRAARSRLQVSSQHRDGIRWTGPAGASRRVRHGGPSGTDPSDTSPASCPAGAFLGKGDIRLNFFLCFTFKKMMSHSYDVPGVVKFKFIETGSRMAVARGWGRGRGTGFGLGGGTRSRDGWWGRWHSSVNVLNPLSCALKCIEGKM